METPKIIPENPETNNSLKVDYIRHSIAEYKSYLKILASDNPTQGFDSHDQITSDLTEKGIELAEDSANEYFKKLDPTEDTLFFAASNEARAIETANIYRVIAHDLGFAVEKPTNVRSEYAEELAGGEIRVIESLGVNPNNMLINSLFAPQAQYDGLTLNMEQIPAEEKVKYDEARSIIAEDDKGTWLQNVIAHGEEIDRIFPENNTTSRTYSKQFQDMLRLIRFARTKAASSDKRTHVLAFAHENAVIPMMQEHFDNQGLKNCECIEFVADKDGTVTATFRNKEMTM